MLSEAATCNAVIGLDVGKFSHWACHVSRRGEVLGSGPVANTEHDLDSLLVPPVRPGDRSQNRVRAGDQHKHQRLSRPRPPRILLRDRAQEPAVGQVDIVGELVPAGEQAAGEPAHLLLQLAQPQQGPVRRLLPQMQGPRHVHREALKAVARKRMKVICAIMRDEVPYSA